MHKNRKSIAKRKRGGSKSKLAYNILLLVNMSTP